MKRLSGWTKRGNLVDALREQDSRSKVEIVAKGGAQRLKGGGPRRGHQKKGGPVG